MTTIFLDLQGFKAPPPNTFVLKEVEFSCLGRGSNLKPKHFMVILEDGQVCWSNLPRKYEKINLFLEIRHHGIAWNQGDVKLCGVQEKLNNIYFAYLKAEEKVKWCQKLFHTIPQAVNVENEFNFTRTIRYFPELNHCRKHQGICSLNTVCVLSKYLSPAKVVSFLEKPQVKIIRVWDFASREARKSTWQQDACDRERFQRRIDRAATYIDLVIRSAIKRIKCCSPKDEEE